jgi:tetratricopeptide (TPR) repeat protein
LLGERERLHELALGALARLLAQQRAAGATEAAVQWPSGSWPSMRCRSPCTERSCASTPSSDGAALRQYQVCVAALERELHAEPESETKALYQEILRKQTSRAIWLLYGYASLVTSLGEALLGAGHLDEAGRLATEAVALARERGERGDEGWTLHLTAEIAARRGPPDVAATAVAYRKALAIAEALAMRALAARCHLGLGALLGSAGEVLEAQTQLARASELFAALGIARWRREAEVLSAEIAH